MRILTALLACFCVAATTGCSHETAPPAGRWEGTYDSGDTIVAARMEITAKGQIFVSAPNAENIGGTSSDGRTAIRQRLATGLATGWDDVTPIQLDFDGQTFRKPGGVAPQAEWDSSAHRMTLIVYLGRGDGIRIPLRAVKDFSPSPFPGG
jgi:hypothetical protein